MSAPTPSLAGAGCPPDASGSDYAATRLLRIPSKCEEFTLSPTSATPEPLLCCISCGPLVHPMQHKQCGQCVCRACLEVLDWKCPYCNQEDGSCDQYVLPAKPLLAMLDAILVSCPGCNASVPRVSLRAHVMDKCHAKHRFDGLVSHVRSEVSAQICVICRVMYTAPDQENKCSQCFLQYYRDVPSMHSHPIFQKHHANVRDYAVDKIDQIFRETHPSVHILTSLQVSTLIRTYTKASFDAICNAFFGKSEFPRFVLRAVDADRLLLAWEHRIGKDYQLAHLLGPRVLDRWAIKEQRSGVLGCYWLDLGDMCAPPKTREQLVHLWHQVLTDHVSP